MNSNLAKGVMFFCTVQCEARSTLGIAASLKLIVHTLETYCSKEKRVMCYHLIFRIILFILYALNSRF